MKVSNIKVVPHDNESITVQRNYSPRAIKFSTYNAKVVFKSNNWYARVNKTLYPIALESLLSSNSSVIYSTPDCSHLENFTPIYIHRLSHNIKFNKPCRYYSVKPDLLIKGNIINGYFVITQYGTTR